MAAASPTQILLLSLMCDIVTSQTWKVDERKRVEQEDGYFHILYGILAKTRNLISKKGFLVVSWILRPFDSPPSKNPRYDQKTFLWN